MHQRVSSIENTLAYNQIPYQYQPSYEEVTGKYQTRRRAYPQVYHHHQHYEQYYPQMMPQQQNRSRQQYVDYANTGVTPRGGVGNINIMEQKQSMSPQQAARSPIKFAEIPPDDRQQRYQEYLSKQKQPKKDQQQYLSTRDIEGAQPKQVNGHKGKKRYNFHTDVYYNDSALNQSLESQQAIPYHINAHDPHLRAGGQHGLSLDSLSHFDKLYNKRIDWKPLLAAQQQLNNEVIANNENKLDHLEGPHQYASQPPPPMIRQSMGMKPAMLNAARNILSHDQVGYSMTLGQGMAKREQTSSNNYGKYQQYRY
ncbi:hypothetical protein FGO68_gene10386 [Halteria grandinella]|uniref:Uncharacterized protein n=1 Tax=Halteria grandinella TaxID=5974 RepID=A0A8J8NME8_HALGN|nr:hypothetical protein FGO68_gene10386 [Halteria grandinella]